MSTFSKNEIVNVLGVVDESNNTRNRINQPPRMLSLDIIAIKSLFQNHQSHHIDMNTKVQLHVHYLNKAIHSAEYSLLKNNTNFKSNNVEDAINDIGCDIVTNFHVEFDLPYPVNIFQSIVIYITITNKIQSSINQVIRNEQQILNEYIHTGFDSTKHLIGYSIIKLSSIVDKSILIVDNVVDMESLSSANNTANTDGIHTGINCVSMGSESYLNNYSNAIHTIFKVDTEKYLSAEILTPNADPLNILSNSHASGNNEDTGTNGILYFKPSVNIYPYYAPAICALQRIDSSTNVFEVESILNNMKSDIYSDIMNAQAVIEENTNRTSNSMAHVDDIILRNTQEYIYKASIWWQHVLEQHPYLLERSIQMFKANEIDAFHHITQYVSPMKLPRSIRNECNMSSKEFIARYVSLLPCYYPRNSIQHRFEMSRSILMGKMTYNAATSRTLPLNNQYEKCNSSCQSMFSIFSTKNGSRLDHCHLLCSLFLGIGVDAYVAYGAMQKKAGSVPQNRQDCDKKAEQLIPSHWVVTLETKELECEEESTNVSNHGKQNEHTGFVTSIQFWDPLTGTCSNVVNTSHRNKHTYRQGQLGPRHHMSKKERAYDIATAWSQAQQPSSKNQAITEEYHHLYVLYRHDSYYVNIQSQPLVLLPSRDVTQNHAVSGDTSPTHMFTKGTEYVCYDLCNIKCWCSYPMLQPILDQECCIFNNTVELQHVELSNQDILNITTHLDTRSAVANNAFQSMLSLQYQEVAKQPYYQIVSQCEPPRPFSIVQYPCNLSHVETYMETLVRENIVVWTQEAQLHMHPQPVKFDATLSVLLQVSSGVGLIYICIVVC